MPYPCRTGAHRDTPQYQNLREDTHHPSQPLWSRKTERTDQGEESDAVCREEEAPVLDLRCPVIDHELGGSAYVVSVRDNHSRCILSSALTRSQDLSSYLAVLYAAVERVRLANPRGEYDDAHRATVFAGQRGEYRFQSNVPISYGGRPPHIHVRVRAPGYEELVTQHYPERGQRKANFGLVPHRL
jgi:hypothetical protein